MQWIPSFILPNGRVNEDNILRASQGTQDRHDMEYPDIPSIPEEAEEEDSEEEEELTFQVDFPEFSPGGVMVRDPAFSPMLEEKSDSTSQINDPLDIPWRGILKKSNSRMNLNQ